MEKEFLNLKTLRKLKGEELQEKLKKLGVADIDYYLKYYDFFITSDNLIFNLEKWRKYAISKTLWYDDETIPHSLTLDYFVNYNLINSNRYNFFIENKCSISKFRLIKNNYYYYIYFDKHGIEKDLQEKRNFTDNEVADYINILEFYQKNYIERLSKYFKKYKKHIYQDGYWVNR